MADNAHRLIQWSDGDRIVDATNATLDLWRSWGVDGHVCSHARQYGLGGSQRYTGNFAEVGTGPEWTQQRKYMETDFVARAAARGQDVYFAIQASRWDSTGFQGFWNHYFTDSFWDDRADNTGILQVLEGIAGFAREMGMKGVYWDLEDTPTSGGGPKKSWRWNVVSGRTEAEVRAQVKFRGAQMAQRMCGQFPAIELGAYHLFWPRSARAWNEASAGGLSFMDTVFYDLVQHDWLSGLFSTRQVPLFRFADSTWYKSGAYREVTQANANNGDCLSILNNGPGRAFLSNYPGFDWDYASPRLRLCAFTWGDPSRSASEASSIWKGDTFVASQFRAAEEWTSGGTRFNYGHHFSHPPSTGWSYTDPAHNLAQHMQNTSAPRTVDTTTPTITVVSSQTVGSNQVIRGQSYDAGFMIERVSWRNNRSGAIGECKLDFVNLSGRPMQPRQSGTTQPQGAFTLVDTTRFTEWRMDWVATVPLVQANDSITITAHDIHALTASANVTGGVPIDPSTRPTVTSAPASGVAQTTVTLSGTVNPEGLSTTARFEYGTTTAYGTLAPAVSVGAGSSPVPISQNLTGLTPSTVYHYRLTATNGAGTSVTTDRTFTTSAPSLAPIVTLNTAASITQNSAALSGTVDAQGVATQAQFEYGPTTAYGFLAPAAPIAVGPGSVDLPGPGPEGVSGEAVGLAQSTLYHFRLTATNSAGTSVTADQTFATTAAPPPPPGGDQGGAYATEVLNTVGLRAYWRLGETSGAFLDSKSTATGSGAGGITRGTGGIIGGGANGGVLFNGVDGLVTVPSQAALHLANGPLSLLVWCKRSAVSANNDVLMDKGSGAYVLYIGADGRIRFGRSDFVDVATSTTALTDTSAWHMIVATYDTTGVRLYLDAVDVTGTTSVATLTDTTVPLRLGAAEATGGTSSGFMAGSLDEVAIFNVVLSAAAIQDLYELGTSPPAVGTTIGLLAEDDVLHPLTVVGGGGVTSGDPFYLRDSGSASQLRGDEFFRGPGFVAVDQVIGLGLLEETESIHAATANKRRDVGQLAEVNELHAVRVVGGGGAASAAFYLRDTGTAGQLRGDQTLRDAGSQQTLADQVIAIGLITESDTLHQHNKGRELLLLEETAMLFDLVVAQNVPSMVRHLDVDDDESTVEITDRAHTAALTDHVYTAVITPRVHEVV